MAPAHEAVPLVVSPERAWPPPAPRAWPVDHLLIGHGAASVVKCCVSARTESVKTARHFAVEALRGWNVARLRDSVELVVSELVTNALNHALSGLPHEGLSSPGHATASCPIELILMCRLPSVACVVTDPSDSVPVMTDPEEFAESGRGLHVVDTCSRTWGWARFAAGGKAVWATFHCEG